mmetsp:Transcript_20659/g.82506  ORF Transcript_20659/g.82506 Transcript_20659/m.82506 type:complete len:125 (+) Transcript_20659:638-1012(+)
MAAATATRAEVDVAVPPKKVLWQKSSPPATTDDGPAEKDLSADRAAAVAAVAAGFVVAGPIGAAVAFAGKGALKWGESQVAAGDGAAKPNGDRGSGDSKRPTGSSTLFDRPFLNRGRGRGPEKS